jgi:hypothetical protein
MIAITIFMVHALSSVRDTFFCRAPRLPRARPFAGADAGRAPFKLRASFAGASGRQPNLEPFGRMALSAARRPASETA